jgi:MFS family permease
MLFSTDPRSARAQWTLWSVVFVDLVGYGVISPLAPFYMVRTGLAADAVTLVIAAYSLAQFLAMPLWGHVSDRWGRRPVLLVSMAGHAASYLLLAVAGDWPTLLLARIVGGVTSANLVTAYAYVADVTPSRDRPKAIGRISAAFGLGFVVGPALGGLLAGGGGVEEANLVAPALAAAAMSALSFAGILFFLPESRGVAGEGATQARPGLLEGLGGLGGRPVICGLVGLGVLVVTFVAAREAILPLWAHDKLGLTPRDVGLLLAVSGAVVALVQFFATGPLSERFGSLRLVAAAVVLFAAGWIGLILSQTWLHLALSIACSAIGTAFFQSNMPALVSERAGAQERGMLLGVYQASNSLARFGGQAASGSMYRFVGQDSQFVLGSVMMAPALLLLAWIGRRMTTPARLQAPAE